MTHLSLENFKGFRKFTLRLGERDVYLVGPNNAGKSTLLAAARSIARMVRIAQRERAEDRVSVDGVDQWGHFVASSRVELRAENLRHEFTAEPTQLAAGFGRDVRLTARWASVDDNEEAFFFVKDNDVTLRLPADVRRCLPRIVVVPVLGPIEAEERPLSDSQIAANLDSRLASRHFRNQIAYMGRKQGIEAVRAFFDYVNTWTPEIDLLEPTVGSGDIDIYYREHGGRHPRKISWAGDGMQVWLQILLHLYRAADAEVVVLDEPEVFLHPDLQHRLVHVLLDHPAQTIMATHSAEVLAEAADDSVVWIQRTRKQSIRKPSDGSGAELTASLGSAFNLDLARALKAKAVVFVEGDDVAILRRLAKTVGASEIGHDRRIAVIRLEGFDRWDRVEAFKWLTDDLLGKHVAVHVLLDRDYRADEEVAAVEASLRAVGVVGHVWGRHELENYLLVPPAIARVSGSSLDDVQDLLGVAAEELRDEFRAGYVSTWMRTHRGHDARRALTEAKAALDDLGRQPLLAQLAALPGKEIRARLNQQLGLRGRRPVSDKQLAAELWSSEIDREVHRVLRDIEGSL